jgi:hypothetical protein
MVVILQPIVPGIQGSAVTQAEKAFGSVLHVANCTSLSITINISLQAYLAEFPERSRQP